MARSGYSDILKNGGYQAFLWTQFLGAFNDSVYQTIVALHAGSVKGGAWVPLVPAVFTLPALLFSGWSGHLADRVSKRSVLIGVKIFEIAVMLVGLAMLHAGSFGGMMLVVFLMGLHATVFSPAKYGIVPEILPGRDLSRGNALLEMSTFVAIVLGIGGGGVLFAVWRAVAWRIGIVTLAVAIIGFLSSLRIARVAPSGAKQAFPVNPFGDIAESTRHLLRDRALWLAVLGVCYFWFAGVLLKTDLQFFGLETLKASDRGVSLLWGFLAVGIGVGNLLAGRLSGDKVELGLVPLGAGFMGLFALAACFAGRSLIWAAVAVGLMALSSGLFVVPLYAYVQQRSERQEKGRVLATNNFLQTFGMLLAAGLMLALHTQLHVGAAAILAGFGILSIALAVYIVLVVPEYSVRFGLWLLTHTVFRIRIVGQENVPARGAALLVANHLSQADGLLVAACVQRFIRFLVWKPYYEKPLFHHFLRLGKAIPVGQGREALDAVRAARRELAEGHVVCIFAEGAISRIGNLLPFQPGLEHISRGLDVPIIPVHLDGVWGSIFSFERGRFLWKWPRRIPYPVTVCFGAPMPANSSAHQVREAIQELGAEAADRRKKSGGTLDRRLIRTARRHWNRLAIADSTGRELTYGRLLTAGLLVARQLPEERTIGVVLPASAAAAVANVAITLAGRVPVNLNFTAGREAKASAVAQCGIRTVITTRKMAAQVEGLEASVVFIEDLLGGPGTVAKLRALVAARFAPRRTRHTPDSLATVCFSSGSTGIPKGVMLSHHNAIANIEAMAQAFRIAPEGRLASALPYFHSFGFTVTLWFPLTMGWSVVYHPNPLDAKGMGELAAKYRPTMLLSTPTFCSAYVRKCEAEQFASLECVLVGSEKLREPVARAFEEKFGVALLEGYGATEMSPVIAVNAPDFADQKGSKAGTVGKPLPGVAARVVDPETFEPLPPESEGLLMVKGPNRMIGYLGQPERTAEVLRDGWYVTGDIAAIDRDGFLRITDRLSRFSKIAGEMVPHVKVEEAMAAVLEGAPCAVTAIPDEQRGERLAALYAASGVNPAELWQRLAATDLPRLWLPKRENLYPVESLPQLGTGKLDLRALQEMARRLSQVTV
jgi:acyl-[acyl-carrier-protein]-phospholipid O-acyltransferase / long-chain-fatty-acid--[acyl-carrier-protein] ligase